MWGLDSGDVQNILVALGVVVAIASVHTARALARKKQTADLIFAARNDEKLAEGYNYISEYNSDAQKNIRSLASLQCDAKHSEAVRYVLNHLEGISVGVAEGIYDEAMLKRTWCSIIIRTYEETQPLISEIRRKKGKSTTLQEFEWLAKRWIKKPLKPRKP